MKFIEFQVEFKIELYKIYRQSHHYEFFKELDYGKKSITKYKYFNILEFSGKGLYGPKTTKDSFPYF